MEAAGFDGELLARRIIEPVKDETVPMDLSSVGSRVEAFLSRYRWERAVALLVGLAYWFANRSIGGPAYQQDEVGYLVNAAFLSGHAIDGFSSYHAGYSLFLAPLFALLGSPEEVWQGVKLVNAALWSLSFYSLALFLRRATPETTETARFLAVVASAAYPAWVAMAGYAFSQGAFVLVFVLAARAHLACNPNAPLSVLPSSLLCGFLYWIHPTAIGAIIASVLAVAVAAVRTRRYLALFVHVVVIGFFLVTYKLGIQPWMADRMTPPGYEPRGHYPSIASVVARLDEVRFWRDWLLVVLGQLSYLAIATFGAVVFGVAYLQRSVTSLFREGDQPALPLSPIVAVFLLGSVVGVAMITATSFASQPHGPGSIDEWIYGRYAEGTLLPLLAIGLLVARSRSLALMVGLAVAGIGLVLQQHIEGMTWFNLVCVQAFWPQALFGEASLAHWFLIGAVAVALSYWLLKPLGLIAVIAVYVVTVHVQLGWHRGFSDGYSRPSALVDFVRTNYPKGSCVGFDPFLPQGATSQMAERIRLYSFFLYDYSYQRSSAKWWLTECQGPLITYDSSIASRSERVRVAGREIETGLLILVKDNASTRIPQTKGDRGGVAWGDVRPARCRFGECFTAEELSRWSTAGRLAGDFVETNGRPGWLIFGPYVPRPAGKYEVALEVDVEQPEGATLEVASGKGKLIHAAGAISHLPLDDRSRAVMQFELPEQVTDLEIRLKVTDKSRLKLRAYEIRTSKGG